MTLLKVEDLRVSLGAADGIIDAVPGGLVRGQGWQDLGNRWKVGFGQELSGLNPSFRPASVGETITPGNTFPLNDGASAMLLGSEAAGRSMIGVDPIARIAGRRVSALEPQLFGFAPVEAAERALARACITWADVSAAALNETLAVQSLARVDAWLGQGLVDPEIVIARGGAIAIDHPLGASGGRILGTLAPRLTEFGERYGVAAICVGFGVGQALAVMLENAS